MTRTDYPVFLSDRDPLVVLERQADAVISMMRQWGIGKVDEKSTVHFCGLIHNSELGTVAFLPREAITGEASQDLETAALTMWALARFGSETSNRDLEDDGEAGNLGTLSVIKRLSDDFRDHGLFTERLRFQTRNSGKPDWTRTVKREIAIPNHNGQPIFPDIRTSRQARSSDALLAQIQAAVIREIHSAHAWWLSDGTYGKQELMAVPKPPFPRSTWSSKLDALLPTLYSARAVFLAEYLGFYLRETRASDSGSFVFGISDFHTVWETILRETIVRSPSDSKRNWNSLLPKPVYVLKVDGSREARRRGMQTDIILEHASGYTIVDAKYYSAISAESAPGWPDIAKQMFYEMALREIVDDSTSDIRVEIQNVFVFPGKKSEGPLIQAEIRKSDGTSASAAFSPIVCTYVSVKEALDCYVRGTAGISVLPESGPA